MKTWLILGLATLLFACEGQQQKLDRELAWKSIKPPYDVTTSGTRIGSMTVPGHTQRITFFVGGIPKDDWYSDDDVPRVIGKMDRDADTHGELLDLADLDKIAIEAYNHGIARVVLIGHMVYAITSDDEEDAADAVNEASGEP